MRLLWRTNGLEYWASSLHIRLIFLFIIVHVVWAPTQETIKKFALVNFIIAVHIGPATSAPWNCVDVFAHDHCMLVLQGHRRRESYRKWNHELVVQLRYTREGVRWEVYTIWIWLLQRPVLFKLFLRWQCRCRSKYLWSLLSRRLLIHALWSKRRHLRLVISIWWIFVLIFETICCSHLITIDIHCAIINININRCVKLIINQKLYDDKYKSFIFYLRLK